jgi:hypothetical protein
MMIPIDQALKLSDFSQIRAQIDIRVELILSCVGNLYPGILSSEVQKLRTRLIELERNTLHT